MVALYKLKPLQNLTWGNIFSPASDGCLLYTITNIEVVYLLYTSVPTLWIWSTQVDAPPSYDWNVTICPWQNACTFTEANEYFSNKELKILLLSSSLSWIRGPHIFVFKSPIKNIFPTSLYTEHISCKSSILYRNNSKVYVMLNRASIWGGFVRIVTWPEITSPEVRSLEVTGNHITGTGNEREIISCAFYPYFPRFSGTPLDSYRYRIRILQSIAHSPIRIEEKEPIRKHHFRHVVTNEYYVIF